MKTASCDQCGSAFPLTVHNRKRCSTRCNSRAKNKIREARPTYAQEFRAYNLKKKFGLGIEQYETMMAEQNFRCAICSVHQSQERRNFAVDHDHLTGEIRGLLCINCNRGIGALKDSPELLEKAIGYLRAGKL